MQESQEQPELSDIGHFFENSFGERYLYAVNGPAFERTGSELVLAGHFGEDLFQEDSLYVICGSDSGLLPRFIASHGRPVNSHYIFVEPPEVLELVRPAEPEEGLHYCAPDAWESLAESLNAERFAYLSRLRALKSLGAEDARLPAYTGLWRSIKSATDYMSWYTRSKYGLYQHMGAQLLNLPQNLVPGDCLKDALPAHTAVVIGGGPSLDSQLDWIRNNRDRLVVIVVSRMCRALQQAGITPDIIVCIDPYEGSFEVGKEMLAFQNDALFVAGFHCYPPLAMAWHGHKVYIGPRFPWSSDLDPGNLPQWGPTVTNSALHIGLVLGCRQVVLAGVDLCYSPEGYTHASGTDEHDAGPALMEGDQLVETNAGGRAETKNEFVQAAEIIAKLAAMAKEQGQTVLNPAPDAARIDHVDHVPLDDIRLDATSVPVRERLFERAPIPDASRIRSYYRDLARELREVRRDIGEIRKLAQEAADQGERMAEAESPAIAAQAHKRIEAIERKLEKRYQRTARFLKMYGLRYFMLSIRTDDEREWTEEEANRYPRIYYGAYLRTCDEAAELLERALERLQMAEMETGDRPDLDRLRAFWERERLFHHAIGWLENHRARLGDVPADTLDSLLRELRAAARDMERNALSTHTEFARSTTSLNGLPARAAEYFHQSDRVGLERLLRGLERHADRDEAARLEQLVRGYIAIIDERPEAALAAFSAVGEGVGYEDACMRRVMLHLDLEQFEEARRTLELLTARSPFFLPFHAELCRILGDVQAAIDSYTEYLKHAPQDRINLLKLGLLYHELGVDEGTLWIMGHILEQDPGNRIAIRVLQELDARMAQS